MVNGGGETFGDIGGLACGWEAVMEKTTVVLKGSSCVLEIKRRCRAMKVRGVEVVEVSSPPIPLPPSHTLPTKMYVVFL